MIIFRDILSNYEIMSDAYPMTDDKPARGMMTFSCRMKKVDGLGNIDIGANASQEEEEEQLDDESSEQKVDVVEAFKLVETSMDKKGFKSFIKGEVKKLEAKLKENMTELKVPEDKMKDKMDVFKADASDMVKWVLGNFEDIQMMIGEDFHEDCMPGFLINKGLDDIKISFFKHALEEEKC